jgi:hypothetical protein
VYLDRQIAEDAERAAATARASRPDMPPSAGTAESVPPDRAPFAIPGSDDVPG